MYVHLHTYLGVVHTQFNPIQIKLHANPTKINKNIQI